MTFLFNIHFEIIVDSPRGDIASGFITKIMSVFHVWEEQPSVLETGRGSYLFSQIFTAKQTISLRIFYQSEVPS
jgi:hypothetical protein